LLQNALRLQTKELNVIHALFACKRQAKWLTHGAHGLLGRANLSAPAKFSPGPAKLAGLCVSLTRRSHVM
jgi:hypothetical protein